MERTEWARSIPGRRQLQFFDVLGLRARAFVHTEHEQRHHHRTGHRNCAADDNKDRDGIVVIVVMVVVIVIVVILVIIFIIVFPEYSQSIPTIIRKYW